MNDQAQVRCDSCESWIPVETFDGRIECECGQSYLVTITPMPSPTV